MIASIIILLYNSGCGQVVILLVEFSPNIFMDWTMGQGYGTRNWCYLNSRLEIPELNVIKQSYRESPELKFRF